MTTFVMKFDVLLEGVLVDAESALEAMEKAPGTVENRILTAIDASGIEVTVGSIDVYHEPLVGDEGILEVDE